MSTNDPQQQMIRDAMQAIAQRKPGKTKLVYDKTKRTIVAVAEGTQVPRALNITADDADMFAVATLSSAWLRQQWPHILRDGTVPCSLSAWDDGDALTQCELGSQPSRATVTGTIVLAGREPSSAQNVFRALLNPIEKAGANTSEFVAPDGSAYRATAFRAVNGADEAISVAFADVQPELETRRSGVLETTILADKSVLCIGLGTGGAHAALELAKCGVGSFTLVDRDRLSVGNVVRHPGGISQVGRFKVNVIRDLIHEKNPDAKVAVYPRDLTYENVEELGHLIAQADVVICGTDNRTSKLLVNRLCIEANIPAVYGGAFRRAYGGQVLRVRPKASPCHQCFVAAMPEEASNVEVSSASDAADIAYSDQPVAVEPGLSLDVLPIANMVAKLALSELLKNKPSTLRILDRDYDAPWYLWLNRPEAGTPYADWPPLSESSDEMTINRWYGIYFDRDEDCPICGNFISSLAANYGLNLGNVDTLPAAPPDGSTPAATPIAPTKD
jgi:molybdopterin/thiamine biosynthesis adenylyltransferase